MPTPALRIVPAAREHHPDFARFFAGLELDDPVPDVERWAAEMAPWTFFLAEGETLVGYAFSEVYGERAYVRHVVVAPDARGRGVGRALMRELSSRFRAAGASRWELNVKRDNHAAIALYGRCGMRPLYATTVVRLDWAALARLPGTARPLVARAVEPEQDRDVEAAFRLPDGKLARLRALEGTVLAQLVERGAVVAFARFNPSFPGCFPFRVAAPELARPLIESLAAHARPGDAWIQLVIEDDDATAAMFLAAGARTYLEIVHMSGAIPES
ncbi:MAG: GNAT family N-acetyltransferase [Planctomycetota bacterium]|nr:GNAT family N-acetyltransferase [Planctomycetota bacterium]